MATTNKIIIGIDNETFELKGEELKEFNLDREQMQKQIELEKLQIQARKELQISAYKKLGLTDEEIAAII